MGSDEPDDAGASRVDRGAGQAADARVRGLPDPLRGQTQQLRHGVLLARRGATLTETSDDSNFHWGHFRIESLFIFSRQFLITETDVCDTQPPEAEPEAPEQGW